MTRRRLNRQLFLFIFILLIVLIIAGIAKFSLFGVGENFQKLYEFINDMSLLIFTIGAAYMANIFQKRSNFVDNLRDEWREIVRAKSALIRYIDNPNGNIEEYLDAYQSISRCIDFMRIVYCNVGETSSLIGKYPYEPLHDMRRAFEVIDPRQGNVTIKQLQEQRHEIWDSFNALRENFLDEFELEEPQRPIIGVKAGRKKVRA